MVKMMRANLLVDAGELVGQRQTELIEWPDAYKRVNVQGRILSVGPKATLFGEKDVGRMVILRSIHSQDTNIPPSRAEAMGLKPNWHFIVHEKDVTAAVD